MGSGFCLLQPNSNSKQKDFKKNCQCAVIGKEDSSVFFFVNIYVVYIVVTFWHFIKAEKHCFGDWLSVVNVDKEFSLS